MRHDELNIQVHNSISWEDAKEDDLYYHYMFPLALNGRHGFQTQKVRSYQLDLRGAIEVIQSPVQFFPRLRDTTDDIKQRTRINVLARYFWEQVNETFHQQKKDSTSVTELANILYTVLWESVTEGPLSLFWEMLDDRKEESLEKLTAREVVDKMCDRLQLSESEAGKINETTLQEDLKAYVDPGKSRRFKDGVDYFWDTDYGAIVMVNSTLDYMTVLAGWDL